VRRGREDLYDEPRPGRPSPDYLSARIQEILNENPFESARSIADILHISHSTVLKHLHEDLHFQSFYLRSIPHLLTPELREQRCRYTSEMIPILTAATRDGWRHPVISVESWFFLSYSQRRMWTRTRDDVATKPKHDIHTTKFMFTVLWNPLGFHVIDKLPTGARMNSEDFTTNILAPLEQKIFPSGRKPHAKRLTIHLDNARYLQARRLKSTSGNITCCGSDTLHIHQIEHSVIFLVPP
jgi:hypothetical protein